MRHLILVIMLILLTACASDNTVKGGPAQVIIGNMKLTSPAFEHNGAIPSEYTCDGEDINPELNIADIPEQAKTFALIVDDPDAPRGTWDHWIVFNIPVTDKIEKNSVPGAEGTNSFKRTSYGGPCPPSGTHRYFFKLYALDTELDLEEGASKEDLIDALGTHSIDQATLMGTYSRD